MTDRELLQAISQKESLSFDLFYKRYAAILLRWIRRYTQDVMLSEDITQNFWMKVWLDPERIKVDEDGSAKNFLLQHFTFYVLECIKANRRHSAEQAIEEMEDDLSYTHVEEDCGISILNHIIEEALGALSPESNQLFEIVCKKGYTLSSAAEELGLNERTVRYKLKQCLEALRYHLQEKGSRMPSGETLKNSSYVFLTLLLSLLGE